MKRWLAALLVILPFSAGAQMVAPQPCAQSLACLQQRVLDLKEYREWLEDQLALAKALLQAKEAELAGLRAKGPAEVPSP